MAEKKVAYEFDGRKFEGMLVYDDGIAAKRPAIFMQPDWLGVCRHSIDMAHEVADEDYVRESIMEPQAKVVAGFQPVMPTFKGRLTDQEVTAIIEYLKTLK